MTKKTHKVIQDTAVKVATKDSYNNSMARLGALEPNLLAATRYPNIRLSRNFNLMTALFRNNWIVRKALTIIARDMTKNWIDLTSNITPEENDAFKKAIRITHTRKSINEAIMWGDLYGGAAAIMLIEGQEDSLEEPLDIDSIGEGDFKGLIVLDRWSGIYPQLELVDDISSPEYGMPKYYQVKVEDGTGESVLVHHSRILRFIGHELPLWEKMAESYWGASVIESVYTEIIKRDNASANVAQLIFMANLRVLKMSDLGQLLATVNERSQKELYNTLQAQNLLMSNMGIYVMDKEDEFQNFQYSFGGLHEIYELFMLDVAGALDIPATRLYGRSPDGMNSTGDGERVNYYDMIEGSQEAKLRFNLEKLIPVVLKSSIGYVPDDCDFEFRPVETPTQKDLAEVTWRSIEGIRGVFDSGIISQQIALKELKSLGDVIGLFTNITDEDINKASNELQSPLNEGLDEVPSANEEEDRSDVQEFD